MNTERLFEILRKLVSEEKKIVLLKKVRVLTDYMSQQVNEPTNATPQTAFSEAFSDLKKLIDTSWFMQLTPLEADVLDSMGLELLVGRRLPDRVTALMRESGVLPAVVRDELAKISDNLTQRFQIVTGTIANFENLGLEEASLAPGEGELALRIPRSSIGERYPDFINDAKFLDDLVSVSQEIVTGSRDQIRLRSLSSSAYTIFLQIDPAVVAFTVLTIERVMNGYKTILEIRVLRDQLKKREMPESVIVAVEDNIVERVEAVARDGVEAALAEIDAKAEAHRLNELRNHAAILFKQLIERLEQGYDLDGRVGFSESTPTDEMEKEEHEVFVATDRKVRRGIKAVRKQIKEAKALKILEDRSDG